MENSLFSKLSAELRNDIYKRVLSADRSLAICSGPSDLRKAKQPPITRVCSQIREETLQMFYHCNTFVAEISAHTNWTPDPDRWVIGKIDKIEHWLQCTTAQNLANVQDLRLVMTLPDYCYFEDAEDDWEGLNQALRRFGLVEDGANPKMKVIACLRATTGDFKDFRERRKRETKAFFDSLEFEVEVVWEKMDGTWC